MSGWIEIGDGVYVHRHRRFNVNCGLVLGGDQAMLIDTRSWRSEAEELREEVATVTSFPITTVVNTHGHFDHCFGNEVFAGESTIWGHRGCARDLVETGEIQRASMIAHLPEHREELLNVRITPPTALVDQEACIDMGGRLIRLAYHGRGHTDHDLVVSVDNGEVVFAGDLIEEGGPPSFEDAWPTEWSATVGRLLEEGGRLFVPGHGMPVSREAVADEEAALRALVGLLMALDQGEIDERAVMLLSSFPETTTRAAVRRHQEIGGVGPH